MLDEKYIEFLITNIHQTWYMKETQHKFGIRILFINNSEWDKCTTQRLKQGILCNQRIMSFATPKTSEDIPLA